MDEWISRDTLTFKVVNIFLTFQFTVPENIIQTTTSCFKFTEL